MLWRSKNNAKSIVQPSQSKVQCRFIMENLQEHIDRPTLASEQVSVPQLSRREFLWLMGGALALGTSTEAHEETLEKITVTEEGKVWMEKQKDVAEKSLRGEAGGLIDGTTFLQEESKTQLDRCLGTTTVLGHTITFTKLSKTEQGYFYAFHVKYKDEKEETWYLSESPFYRDQFPEGLSLGSNNVAFWLKKGEGVDKFTQGYCRPREIFDFEKGTIAPATLLRKFQQAKEVRESEQNDPTNIRAFDLPRDKSIAYLGLIDANPLGDPVVSAMDDDVKYFPELLSSCGYQIVTDGASRYVPVGEEPADILKRHIGALHKQGVSHFYVKLSGHGNPSGVYFTYPKDGEIYYEVLTPRELFEIFDVFPTCTFYVNTDACHGGGYAAAMKRYKDGEGASEGRVTIFLQTKGYGWNQEGRLKDVPGIKGDPKAHSTYYGVFLANELLKGKGKGTYGALHLLADQASKLLIPSDPEVWRSGKDGGVSTAKIQENLRLKGEINV